MISSYQKLLQTPLEKRKDITIYVGMSGGVDSSVTALLLKQQGFNVKGIYMQCWGTNDPNCRAHKDRADAVKVAAQLYIPFETWNFEKEYKDKVIEYFFNEYNQGRTPNPDIFCNSEIKFKLFLEKAIQNKADYVATGHYAKILLIDKKYYIASPKDKKKDQSYFLAKVQNKYLRKILFPLQDVQKTGTKLSTRKIAENESLVIAKKPDSTGICFLEGLKAVDFLKTRFSEKPGNVLNKDLQVIGTHKGAWFYTIGQRHGFEISKYQGKAMYVLNKNTKLNTITVGDKTDLYSNTFYIEKIKYANTTNLYVRIRNLGRFIKVKSIIQENNKTKIILSSKIDAIAPGQFAVFYKKVDKECIIIAKSVIL